MTKGTIEKAKSDVKKGIAEVGKAAANLKDDAKMDVDWLKANFGHNADAEKKDATRILVTDADVVARPESEKKMAYGKAYTEKTKETVESIFGVNAGIVWDALNLNGPMTIDDLVKATNLNSDEIFGALGWLGRENKISLETRGKVRFFSLRS
jgi:hypothetical protein